MSTTIEHNPVIEAPATYPKKFVSYGGYRGHTQPRNAVCGASCTGSYSDSPCREEDVKRELAAVKEHLRVYGIRFNQTPTTTETTSVFCIKVWVTAPAAHVAKAREAVDALLNGDRASEFRLVHLAE